MQGISAAARPAEDDRPNCDHCGKPFTDDEWDDRSWCHETGCARREALDAGEDTGRYIKGNDLIVGTRVYAEHEKECPQYDSAWEGPDVECSCEEYVCSECDKPITGDDIYDRCWHHEDGCPNQINEWAGEELVAHVDCHCSLEYHSACCPVCNKE